MSSFIKIEDFQMERKTTQKLNSYKFSQIFGYKNPTDKLLEEDVITCLKYDNEGKMIAVGDRAGRIIIFDRSKSDQRGIAPFEYFTEFQAHQNQFDSLRSSEIEESLVDINWLNRQGKYRKLITANSHNIRLWKIYEKAEKKVVRSANSELSMPRLQNENTSITASLHRSFPVKHSSHIKQTSLASNEQYLLSTDDSQMFLWDIERADRPYIVCDMGAGLRVEDCEEINCCEMHPQQDSIFLYGMSKGSLKLGDLRVASKVENNSVTYKSTSSKQRNLLLDAVSSISSATFSKNGKYLVSRDCLSVKIWDVANPNKPLNSIPIHQSLKSKLGEMVDNESIYDAFKLRLSPDGSTILTGSYNNCFHLIDVDTAANAQYELNYRKSTICRAIDKKSAPLTKMDYVKRTLVADFSPVDDTLAVASLNCFFTYSL